MINDRDKHTSDFCECDEYVAEKIPWFNTTQCAVCWKPNYDEVQRQLISDSLARHPSRTYPATQEHRSK